MFTETYKKQMDEAFEKQLPFFEEKRQEIEEAVKNAGGELATALKYLYVTMPLSDAASYEPELFLDYARHGRFLWEEGRFTKGMPEEIFTNYVLQHRINNEDLRPCRRFFYEKLKDRIAGMSMKEAIIEINYWCAEEATYQTTDGRTMSPVAVYETGMGRCGEESTFGVTAFRSVGIPARQVYTPRWAHCDDNHAWVEVWCDGEWYFLGACEPEEVLNKGWFTNASSRAMMIQSRWFDAAMPKEDIVGKRGNSVIINHLERYAKNATVKAIVKDENGGLVEGADVSWELINYGELSPMAVGKTDGAGSMEVTLGQGSIYVFAAKDGCFGTGLMNTALEQEIVLELKKDPWKLETWEEMVFIAPKDSPVNPDTSTKEQKEQGARRFKEAAAKRQAKIDGFYPKERAEELLKELPDRERAEEILRLSRGNFEEMAAFLLWKKEETSLWKWKLALLNSLPEKDYQDTKAEILQAHIEASLPWAKDYPEEIFVPYILCPRIQWEYLTAYKEPLKNRCGKEEAEAYRADPKSLWAMIDETIKDLPEKEYGNLITFPEGALKIKEAGLVSKKVLFVAMCRALGIAARLNPVDEAMEYYEKGGFVQVQEVKKKDAKLYFTPEKEGVAWNYMKNFTIARMEEKGFQTLLLPEFEEASAIGQVETDGGLYRVITDNRLPNGSIFAKTYYFHLAKGETREVILSLKEADLQDMLVDISIPDFDLTEENGEKRAASSLEQEKQLLMIWVEEGMEPTEHILNELREQQEAFKALDNVQIYFVLKNPGVKQDPTLSKTMEALPEAKTLYMDFSTGVEPLARRMYVDPDKLPLIILMKPDLTGIYGTSGYNVGTADMLLRILKRNS